MRVLTYNVHGSIGTRGRSSVESQVSLLADVDADVIALQEVHEGDEIEDSFLRRLQVLKYPLVIHGPTMRRGPGAFGNVLLSRFEALECDLIDLSLEGREPRGAIRVCLKVGERVVEVVTTHLGLLPSERRVQAQRLVDRLGVANGSPKARLRIGLGDFNEALPWARSLRTLRRALGRERRVPTFPARCPLLALDLIFAHPAQALRQVRTLKDERTLATSDHLPLIGEISTRESDPLTGTVPR